MLMVMGLIFFLSQLPGSSLQLPPLPEVDKLGHGILYALLAASTILAITPTPARRTLRAGLLVVLFCLLYGISDEFHQSFVPGRDPSGGDILADTIGAAVAVAVWLRYYSAGRIKAD